MLALAALSLAASCMACSPVYVVKAGIAEMQILRARQPIHRVVNDPTTPADAAYPSIADRADRERRQQPGIQVPARKQLRRGRCGSAVGNPDRLRSGGDVLCEHPFDRFLDIARDAGLPGIIAHGLCTMAMCSQAVVMRLAAGGLHDDVAGVAAGRARGGRPDPALQRHLLPVATAGGGS